VSAPEQPAVNPWIVAVAVMFATFMEVLDTTVVNVSLPHIAGSLSASIDESTWALTSYLVANAIVLPLTGWLANYFGRKRLLLLSISGFTTMEDMFEQRAPLHRHMGADDCGAAAAYLLSEDAANVTGTTLYVDAGYHAMGM